MKKNTSAKIFVWTIIILMILALTIPFMGFLSNLFIDTKTPAQQVNIQKLIDEGKIIVSTATPKPETTTDAQTDTENTDTKKETVTEEEKQDTQTPVAAEKNTDKK